MLYLLPPDVVDELTALASSHQQSLAAYLEDHPVHHLASESLGDWESRWVEAWTASGHRAIAEEDTAAAAHAALDALIAEAEQLPQQALVAGTIVDARVTVADREAVAR